MADEPHGRCNPFISRNPYYLSGVCAQLGQQQTRRLVICVGHAGGIHECWPSKVNPGEKIKISGLGNFESR
jgi:hypothetical protein